MRVKWAALLVCLALAILSAPAEAHIFGTKSDHFIRITPLFEAPVLEVETYARYEWCEWSLDPETWGIVTGDCEPIGEPGFHSINAFSGVVFWAQGDLLREQKMIPALEQIVDLSLIFVGGGKVAQISERMAVKYVIPRLPQLWVRTQKAVKWSIAFIGGMGGAVATDVALDYSKELVGWSVEALEKNNVRTIARSDDPLKSSAAWFEAMIFNPFVLSGQGENNDMIEESFCLTLESVRDVIEMALREGSPPIFR